MTSPRDISARVAAAFLSFSAATLAEEDKELPPLVVESSRGSVVPPGFAGSATVIDAEAIAGSGARSVADLLVSRGGIRVTSTSGNASGGDIHLRGFGENSSSRVLVLVDGRPANRPDMAGVSLLEIPLSRVDSVEILRGSQTARFGDNAVGGVINLVTKSPGDKPLTSIEVAGGGDGYFLTRLAHNSRHGGHGLSFDLERNFTDGWRDNSASELEAASFRWDKEIAPGSELRAGVAWSDEFTGFPGPLDESRYRENPRQSIYAEFGQADQYFSEQSTLRADSTLLLGKSSPFRVEIPVAFSRRDQEWNFGPGSHTDTLLDTFTVAPVLRRSWDKLSVDAGLNFRHDALDLDQFAEIERRIPTGDASLSRQVAGVFSTLDWEPWNGWHLGMSARWERAAVKAEARNLNSPVDPALNFSRGSSETNHAFQTGIRYEPDENTSAWLRYDRLYRLPSIDEIASYQGFPLSVPFNDQLSAETGHNLELGAEISPGPWNLRINGFAQWLEGEIAYDYLRNLNVNFADTRRLGIETSAGYRSDFWEAEIHYTRLGAEFRDGEYAGKDIYLVPRHEAGAVIACHPRRDLTIQAEYQYTGDSFEGNDFTNGAEKLPAYDVANLLFRYDPKPGLSFYFRVNNLLDERYATVKYSGVWYPAAGRQYLIGLRREF